jgi:hypothetical protein
MPVARGLVARGLAAGWPREGHMRIIDHARAWRSRSFSDRRSGAPGQALAAAFRRSHCRYGRWVISPSLCFPLEAGIGTAALEQGIAQSLQFVQGARRFSLWGWGGRAAPVGGRRESVLGGSATASLLSTPPTGATRPPLQAQGVVWFGPGGGLDRFVVGWALPAAAGGRRESALRGSTTASLLSTPATGATRPPLQAQGAVWFGPGGGLDPLVSGPRSRVVVGGAR